MAACYEGDPINEYLQFSEAGVDGVFTDFANTGFAARERFLQAQGRGPRTALRASGQKRLEIASSTARAEGRER